MEPLSSCGHAVRKAHFTLAKKNELPCIPPPEIDELALVVALAFPPDRDDNHKLALAYTTSFCFFNDLFWHVNETLLV